VNDVIMRHDALWPGGLNEMLYVQTPLEVAELRLSCVRHRWPPIDVHLQPHDTQLNLARLRSRLHHQPSPAATPSTADKATGGKKVSAPRPGADRTASTLGLTVHETSPTKVSQQSTKSSLPSPTNRRPATTTKSNSGASPTKTPPSRPQSAPKPPPPPPPAIKSTRLAQPSASTPRCRSQSAKSATGSTSKPGRSSTAGRLAAASTETESTNTSETTSSQTGRDENTEHVSLTSVAQSTDVAINAPCHCDTTINYHQIPAAV